MQQIMQAKEPSPCLLGGGHCEQAGTQIKQYRNLPRYYAGQ